MEPFFTFSNYVKLETEASITWLYLSYLLHTHICRKYSRVVFFITFKRLISCIWLYIIFLNILWKYIFCFKHILLSVAFQMCHFRYIDMPNKWSVFFSSRHSFSTIDFSNLTFLTFALESITFWLSWSLLLWNGCFRLFIILT